MVKNLRLDRS